LDIVHIELAAYSDVFFGRFDAYFCHADIIRMGGAAQKYQDQSNGEIQNEMLVELGKMVGYRHKNRTLR
jgi:hypothetical protein